MWAKLFFKLPLHHGGIYGIAVPRFASWYPPESDLNLPFGKNGKFLFQLGYTPVVSDMKKIVQKTAALSFPKWALAVWDMDTSTLYMVKYDRSH